MATVTSLRTVQVAGSDHLALAAAVLAAAPGAFAQGADNYPRQLIRLVVPYPAGGATSYGCWPSGANCRYYGGDMVKVDKYHDTQARALLDPGGDLAPLLFAEDQGQGAERPGALVVVARCDVVGSSISFVAMGSGVPATGTPASPGPPAETPVGTCSPGRMTPPG